MACERELDGGTTYSSVTARQNTRVCVNWLLYSAALHSLDLGIYGRARAGRQDSQEKTGDEVEEGKE